MISRLPNIAPLLRRRKNSVPPPAVASLYPNYGSQDGGTSVFIIGEGFTGATKASIGGVDLISFAVVSDTIITGVTASFVASGMAGAARDVTVTGPGGVSDALPSAYFTWCLKDLPGQVLSLDAANGVAIGVPATSLGTFTADSTTDLITIVSPLPTGLKVRVSTTGALPGGLVAATDYYLIRASASTYYLSVSLAAALAGTYIDLTTNGTGFQTLYEGIVSGWTDTGGAGHDVTNQVAGYLLRKIGTQNRLAIQGNGAAILQNTVANLPSAAGSIFSVVTIGQWTNATDVGTAGGSLITMRLTTRFQSSYAWLAGLTYVGGNGVDAGNNCTIANDTLTFQAPFCMVHLWNGTGLAPTILVNNVNKPITSGVQGTEDGTTGFMVGGATGFTGKIAEQAVCNVTISAPNLAILHAYTTFKGYT